MNLLLLMNYVSPWVPLGTMYGQISRSWWVYSSKRRLVRVICVSCVVGVGGECVFWMEYSCVVYSASDMSIEVSYWDISMGWVIGIVVEEVDLVIVLSSPLPHTCMVFPWIFV